MIQHARLWFFTQPNVKPAALNCYNMINATRPKLGQVTQQLNATSTEWFFLLVPPLKSLSVSWYVNSGYFAFDWFFIPESHERLINWSFLKDIFKSFKVQWLNRSRNVEIYPRALLGKTRKQRSPQPCGTLVACHSWFQGLQQMVTGAVLLLVAGF